MLVKEPTLISGANLSRLLQSRFRVLPRDTNHYMEDIWIQKMYF